MRASSRRTSGTLNGTRPAISPRSSTPATFFPRLLALPHKETVGKHRQGDVAMPTGPLPDLIVIQPRLPLGLREALLHRPTCGGDLRQDGHGRVGGGVRQIVRPVGWVRR